MPRAKQDEESIHTNVFYFQVSAPDDTTAAEALLQRIRSIPGVVRAEYYIHSETFVQGIVGTVLASDTVAATRMLQTAEEP